MGAVSPSAAQARSAVSMSWFVLCLRPCVPAVRTEQQAAERNATELLATEAQSKSVTEGGQKKSKKKKKASVVALCLA